MEEKIKETTGTENANGSKITAAINTGFSPDFFVFFCVLCACFFAHCRLTAFFEYGKIKGNEQKGVLNHA